MGSNELLLQEIARLRDGLASRVSPVDATVETVNPLVLRLADGSVLHGAVAIGIRPRPTHQVTVLIGNGRALALPYVGEGDPFPGELSAEDAGALAQLQVKVDQIESAELTNENALAGLQRTPEKVEGLLVTTEPYTDAEGITQGRIKYTWIPVNTAVDDGSEISLKGYEIAARRSEVDAPWAVVRSTDSASAEYSPVAPGTEIVSRVRAVSAAGAPGEWSDEVVVVSAGDTEPPPVPSDPILSQKLAVVSAKWDGLSSTGATGVTDDFSHVEVAAGKTTTPVDIVARIAAPGDIASISGLDYAQYWFRYRSVDRSGNASAWSGTKTLTVQSLVDADLISTTIQDQFDARDAAIAQAQADAAAAEAAAATAESTAASAQTAAGAAQAAAEAAEQDAAAAVQVASDAAADLLTLSGRTGRVIRSGTAPTAAEDRSANNLWLNTDNGQLHQWNPTTSRWEVITDSRLDDAVQAATAATNAANTAQAQVDNAVSLAEAAQDQADAANSAAAAAQATATAAQSTADSAASTASAAQGAAQAAQGDADAAAQAAAGAAGIGQAAQDAADAAQSAADAAAADAIAKAAAAEQAAKDHADAQAAAAEAAAIAAASGDASDKAAAAQAAAEVAAAADAQAKADAALAAAQADATTKADAAAAIANSKADVLIQSSTPPASMQKSTTLWIDTTSGLNTPKRWNGSKWAVVTDKAATDAAAAAAAAQSTANQAAQDAATAKSDADAAAAAALAAQATADAADAKATTADGRITTSFAVPKLADGSGKPDGALWYTRSGTGYASIWEWNGSKWEQTTIGTGGISTGAITEAKIATGAISDGKLAQAVKDSISGAASAAALAQQTAESAQGAASAAATAAQAAQGDADAAQATADDAAADLLVLSGRTGRVIRATSAPTATADKNSNNLWLNTSTGQLHEWNGSKWAVITDSRLTAATAAADQAANLANAAQEQADSAVSLANAAQDQADAATSAASAAQAAATAAQSTATSAQSAASAAAADAAAAQGDADAAAQAAAEAALAIAGKADIRIQDAEPALEMRKASTLWIDTTGGANTPKRWGGPSGWVEVTDKAATDAAAAAVAAQDTADQAVADASLAKSTADQAVANALAAQNAADVADGKATTATGKITIATANPTTSDASGKPIGAVWEVRSGSTVLRRYVLTGATTWTQVKIGKDFIGTDAIGQAQISDLAVGTAEIADAAITNAKIGKLAVGEANIDSAAVTNAKIKDLAVTTAKIANLAVETAKIKDGAIVTAKIGDAQITTAKIANLAVDDAKIANLAVTEGKIANLAVGTAKIADGAITNVKIGNATIEAAKIKSVDADKITTGTLDADRIGANTISAEKLLISGGNLFPDPLMLNTNAWPSSGNVYLANHSGHPLGRGLRINSIPQQIGAYYGNSSNYVIPVEPGAKYRVRATVYINRTVSGATQNLRVYFRGVTATGTIVTTYETLVPATGVAYGAAAEFETEIAAPSTSHGLVAMGFHTQTPYSEGVYFVVNNVSMMRMSGSTLIENGAVTSDKVTADAGWFTKLSALSAEFNTAFANKLTADTIGSGTLEGVTIYSPNSTSLPRVKIANSLIEVIRDDGDGGALTTIALGGTSADKLVMRDGSGLTKMQFDAAAGSGAVAGRMSVGSLTVGGASLDEIIDPRPLGMVAHWMRGSSNTASAGSADLGLCQLQYTAVAGRRYRLQLTGLGNGTAGDVLRIYTHWASGHVNATVAGTSYIDLADFPIVNGGFTHVNYSTVLPRGWNGPRTILIVFKNQTANRAIQFYTRWTVPVQAAIYDEGAYPELMEGKETRGGATPFTTVTPEPPAKQTYTKTYNATSYRVWRSGTLTATDTLEQGYYSPHHRSSNIGFANTGLITDLSGATIKKAEVYLRNEHWWGGSGGTVRVGSTRYATTYIANITTVDTPMARYEDKWVPVANFTTTTEGIVLTGNGSTSTTHYGKFAKNVQLRVTYEK